MTTDVEYPPVRDVSKIVLSNTGSVTASSSGDLPWVLSLADEQASNVCERFQREVFARSSAGTVRSYGYDLLRFMRFLDAIDVAWNEASQVDLTDFFLWMKQATKSNGNQNPKTRDARITRNAITGKPYVTAKFAPSSIDHNETVLRTFYEFARRYGFVLMNPVNREAPEIARILGHTSPTATRRRHRRRGHRQGAKPKVPRSMTDEQFASFFEALASDRDRALVSFYVSSGARPSAVLGLDVQDINLPDGLITVQLKGGGVQTVAISLDAVSWYRLYQGDGTVRTSGPAWLVNRGAARPLSYDALRAIFRRANERNGTNWTPHDLRHTAATRMIGEGTNPRTVQEILGHASLDTLDGYTVPRLDEMIAAVRGTRRRAEKPEPAGPGLKYDQSDWDELFGGSTES